MGKRSLPVSSRWSARANKFAHATRALLVALEDVQQTGIEGPALPRKPGIYGPNCGQHVGMQNNAWFFVASIDTPGGGEATFHDALTHWLEGYDVVLIDDVQRNLSNCRTIDDD